MSETRIGDFYNVYIPNYEIRVLAENVIRKDIFYEWSGSGYEGQHHYGEGGLAEHTLEVLKLAFNCAETLGVEIDKDTLFLAVIYHDIGKLWDYERNDDYELDFNLDEVPWVPTKHKRNIHHISRSAMFFYEQANILGFDEKFIDKVIHCILSHHTERQYGSPVAPNSKEAWLLSLCDNISARMNDCETWDYITKK